MILAMDFWMKLRSSKVPSPMRPRGTFAEPDEEELVVERLKAAPRGSGQVGTGTDRIMGKQRFNLQAPPVYDRKVTNLFFSP